MDIKPLDFLLAKSAVDYFVHVFDLELTDELYMFHVYNLAIQMSIKTGVMSEEAIRVMAERDDFLRTIESFKDRYWELAQNTNKS